MRAKRTEIAWCREITDSVIDDMEKMRSSTEDAALRIGELLVEIVRTATEGNKEIKQSVGGLVGDGDSDAALGGEQQTSGRNMPQMLEHQAALIDQFLSMMQGFLDRQLAMSRCASAATSEINNTAQHVSELMMASRMMAINIQIESARQGGNGRTFQVLANQVSGFSEQVDEANKMIARAVSTFVEEMPKLEGEAVAMTGRIDEFRENINRELAGMRQDAEEVVGIVREALHHTETNNGKILQLSQDTLSHLQFQDPVSQGLQRAQHEVSKVQKLLETGRMDKTMLSEIVAEVGNDGSELVDSGEVVLF